MKAYINSISYYLPEKVVTNDDLITDFPEWTVEKVANKIGVNKRHVTKEGETATDLAVNAAMKLFSEHNIDKSKIDFILFCTQSPDYHLPTSACLIQNRLGLSTSCGAIDFNLGCSGYVYGLSLAKGLLLGGVAKNILLLTAETYSKFIHPKDKGNRTIFGDAATATLISDHGFASIEDFSLGTDGSGADNLIVRNGAARSDFSTPITDVENLEREFSDSYLYMNGPEIFNFTLERVPEVVNSILQKNNLLITDINYFIFHQANKYMLNFLRKKMKVDEAKFVIQMEDTGNTVSSTIPIALYIERQKSSFVSEQNILLVGFGVGYSWGACVVKIS